MKTITRKLDKLLGKADSPSSINGLRRTQLRILHEEMHNPVTGEQQEPSYQAVIRAARFVGRSTVVGFIRGHRYPHNRS